MKYKIFILIFVILLATACSQGEQALAPAPDIEEINIEPTLSAELPTQEASVSPPKEDAPLEGQHPPASNPFENLTSEQESCLREALSDEGYTAITSFQRPPTPEEGPSLQECLGDLFMSPPDGPPEGEAPGGEGGHDPSSDKTYYTTSADGIKWETGTLLSDAASVPDVIRTSDGTLWAYWVDFSDLSLRDREHIGIARSDNNGNSWEKLGLANFSGLGDIVPVDPDLIELPDGRLRMYFYDIAVHQPAHPIYSAISEDGINFEKEEGTRVTIDNVYDPDVIQLADGGYRMYLNAQDILSAYSADGITFTLEEGIRAEKGSVPGSILMSDGSVRMYNCAGGISLFESQDGLNFTLIERGVIHDETMTGKILCDPSITAIPGGYLLVYKIAPGKQ